MNTFIKTFKKGHKEERSWVRSKKNGNWQSLPIGYDDFELVRVIGQGAFAKVYAAKLKGKGVAPMDAAIRVGNIEEQRNWDGRKLSDEEMRDLLDWLLGMAENVKTKHICKQLGWRTDKQHVYGITELMQGGELFDRIVSGPEGHLTEAEAREMTRSLCECMAEAHELGFIHRDLKPENIMLRGKDGDIGDICILDWESCTEPAPPEKVHHQLVGTPGYVAPEMLLGTGYGRAVDAWSLGICIYEALTGRSPYLSTTPENLNRETLERSTPWPARYWKSVSPEALNFTKRLLAKDPKQRMSMPEALKHPWLQETEALVAAVKFDAFDLTELSVELPKAITMRETRKSMAANRLSNKMHPLVAAI